LGPLTINIEREDWASLPLPCFTLARLIIERWRTEIRLDASAQQMLAGYSMVDRRHQGAYLGACDIQIEIGNDWCRYSSAHR
jgi:hypothetical protein